MSYRRNKNTSSDMRGLSVEVKNGDFNRAMRKFKKLVQEDGLLQELRTREYYEKPSIKRRAAKKAARNRHLKSLSKRNDQLGY